MDKFWTMDWVYMQLLKQTAVSQIGLSWPSSQTIPITSLNARWNGTVAMMMGSQLNQSASITDIYPASPAGE